MVKFSYKLFFVFAFVINCSFAQEVKFSNYTDTTKYYVGDYINYIIEITHDKNVQILMPSVKDSIKDLDFIRQNPTQTSELDEKITEIYQFIFSKYDSADVTIPSFKIFYSVSNSTEKYFIITDSLSISIVLLPVDTSKDIIDVKAPLRIPLEWWVIPLIVVGILIVGFAGYYLYKYYKKRKSNIPVKEKIIQIPLHEIALKKLKELEEKKLWQQGKIKEYHTEITEIIRKYFEDRFNFIALEMTSGEILENLKYHSDGVKILEVTENFLTNADLVKFAKFKPMPNVNNEMMIQAYSIVEQTKKE
ncbi:MAG: hypothetical protein JXA68_06870, partial [Ignavibacteriales bacterium]|nr:hypothetical protein [Ignavibacteriales bacterium]